MKRLKQKKNKTARQKRLANWVARRTLNRKESVTRKIKELKITETSWEIDDELEIAKKEYQRRKKKGRLFKFYRTKEDEKPRYAWFTKRLRDPDNPEQIKFWGVEVEENRPKRRRMANGDYSPEDWLFNPPDPKDSVEEVLPRRLAFAQWFRRVMGYPRVITTMRTGSSPIDWKAALLVTEKAGEDSKKVFHFRSYEKFYVTKERIPVKIKTKGDKSLPYMLITATGITYCASKKDVLQKAKKVFERPGQFAKQGIVRKGNSKRWIIKYKEGRYRLFKSYEE